MDKWGQWLFWAIFQTWGSKISFENFRGYINLLQNSNIIIPSMFYVKLKFENIKKKC